MTAPHADRFEPLAEEKAAPWANYAKWKEPYLAKYLGIEFLEVRRDYARMRLPFRTEVTQPQGVVHGGAIATLIDTVVVPAIAAVYDHRVQMLTLALDVQFQGYARDDAVVAEGWVTKRGRSIVFCQIEVRAETTGDLVATGTVVYKVGPIPGS